MRWSGAVGVLLASAIVFADPPGPASAAGGCLPRGAKVLKESRAARVFGLRTRLDGETHQARYACLKGSSRRYRLGYEACIGAGAADSFGRGADMFRLAGPYVGFVSEDCDEFGSWDSVRVVDLRTGRTKYRLTAMQFTRSRNAENPSVTALVMARSGSVAWIGCAEMAVECLNAAAVQKRETVGGKRLDYEAPADDAPSEIALKSLRLHGSTLTWTRKGVVKRGVLH